MVQDKGILYAARLSDSEKANKLSHEEVEGSLKNSEKVWVHLDAHSDEAESWLQKVTPDIDNIIINALFAEETRPRIFEYDEGILVILRGVNLNEDSTPEDMISIRLWIDQDKVISVQRRNLKAVRDIQQNLERGTGPVNTGDFIVQLVSRLFARMEPIFTELEERLDDIEEQIIESPEAEERWDIITVRKQAIVFRRFIAPQRDVIAYIRTINQNWLDATQKRHLHESHDQIVRYLEDLETIRDRAQIVKDELASALSDKLNRHMYILTVIAAIFLPLGFITGLLGINVGGMPGAEVSYAFWVVMVLLIAISAAQVWLFRRMKFL